MADLFSRLLDRGDLTGAAGAEERARALARSAPAGSYERAWAHWITGRLEAARGDHGKAVASLGEAVATARQAGRLDVLARGWLTELAKAQRASGDAAGARTTLEEALRLQEGVAGGVWETVRARVTLARVMTELRDHPAALAQMERAAAEAAVARPRDQAAHDGILVEWAAMARAAGRNADAARIDRMRLTPEPGHTGPVGGPSTGPDTPAHAGHSATSAPETPPPPPPEKTTSEEDLKAVFAELDELVGLDEVKKALRTLVNVIRVQERRKEKGLKLPSMSHHLVFTGPPGTGKTTVARLLGRMYKALGILASGHLVEVDRSGLVAEFVGQTAIKTQGVCDRAIDGVLFVDEAYALAQGGDEDFGREALSTLLKRMEDDRERLVVVLAGYEDEMAHLISSNPGLDSRFPTRLHFRHYTAPELAEIFRRMAKGVDYTLSPDADAHLVRLTERMVALKLPHFGNAREMRNAFEDSVAAHANRVVDAEDGDLSTLEPSDIVWDGDPDRDEPAPAQATPAAG